MLRVPVLVLYGPHCGNSVCYMVSWTGDRILCRELLSCAPDCITINVLRFIFGMEQKIDHPESIFVTDLTVLTKWNHFGTNNACAIVKFIL
ncbi:unnamed protein product [Closterium sp. Yama58-4]|nr:unnamed protein product [Closterium sp. Yama58-4]